MAAEFKKIQPEEFHRKFLEQKKRPDGRSLTDFRPTFLNIGSISTAEGSALIKLGNTTVVCGVKAELFSPKADTPKEGLIVPNVELPPLCSPRFRPGPPSEQAQVTSQLMCDIVQNSGCLNLEDLCILQEKLAWCLYCDMVCLDYDGNISDACVAVLIAALRSAKLPTVLIDDETEEISVDHEKRKSLPLRTFPVAASFSVFDNDVMCADPTAEEEALAMGIVTVVTLEDGQICTLHKPGGSPLSKTEVQDCINRAMARATEVRRLTEEVEMSVER